MNPRHNYLFWYGDLSRTGLFERSPNTTLPNPDDKPEDERVDFCRYVSAADRMKGCHWLYSRVNTDGEDWPADVLDFYLKRRSFIRQDNFFLKAEIECGLTKRKLTIDDGIPSCWIRKVPSLDGKEVVAKKMKESPCILDCDFRVYNYHHLYAFTKVHLWSMKNLQQIRAHDENDQKDDPIKRDLGLKFLSSLIVNQIDRLNRTPKEDIFRDEGLWNINAVRKFPEQFPDIIALDQKIFESLVKFFEENFEAFVGFKASSLNAFSSTRAEKGWMVFKLMHWKSFGHMRCVLT